jgi:microcompartment protein CcmL/EutN
MAQALGLIETVGYTTAVAAADAALKAAKVNLLAVEKVIGVAGSLGVTLHLGGEVAAVSDAVEAGKEAALRIGKLVSAHVIAKAHEEVSSKILARYESAPAAAGPTASDLPDGAS